MSNTIRKIGTLMAILVLYAIPSLVTQAQTVPDASTSVAGGPEILHLKVTAYTSLADETDSTPFITADGDTVHDGIVATNLLPFGTKVTIPSLFGNKIFTVDDRMNKKLSKNIDIWMSTKSAAIIFGVHMADIIVIPGQIIAPSLAIADSK